MTNLNNMKKYLLLFAVCLNYFLPAQAQTMEKVATNFVEALTQKQFDKAYTYFDYQTKTHLTVEQVAGIWQQMENLGGIPFHQMVITDQNAAERRLNADLIFSHKVISFAFSFTDSLFINSFLTTGIKAKDTVVVLRDYEKAITIPVTRGKIEGTLIDAAAQKKPTLAIIVAGSGPTDRDGNNLMGVQANAYKYLADALKDKNISSFRYDKRMVGRSNTFDANHYVKFEDYVQDLQSIIQYFSKQYKEIVLIGHSEGSLIATMAAQGTLVHKIVALTPMSLSYGETLRAQLKSKVDNETYQSALDIIGSFEKGFKPKSVPENLAALFNDDNMPFLISAMRYDPKVELRKLNIPVLLVSGENDLQVTPAWVKGLADDYKKGNYTEIKGMNHILKITPKDAEANFESYTNPEMPIAPTLIEKIISFL